MSKRKHSYVPFYMDDWAAATAHMPRPVWSVLFQVCLYNWDKAEPVPQARLKIMLADMHPDGEGIVNALVESGSLEVDERGVFSPRAIREAQKARALWIKKSEAGKKGRSGDKSRRDSMSDASVMDESSREPEPEPEPDSTNVEIPSPSETRPPAQLVAEAWQDMAASTGKDGIPQIKVVSTERGKRLNARIEEHGADAIIAGIKTIPDTPFLMGQNERGWKANFDWLLQPKSCVKLLEGGYRGGTGKPSGWTGD